MTKSQSKRARIAGIAAQLYIDNPDFTMKELAAKSGISKTELYKLFPNRKYVLEYYYTALITRVIEVTGSIDGYDVFTLAEKLGTLAYTLIDLMLEDREYAEKTFHNLICSVYHKTTFEKMVESELREIISNDKRISTSASFFMISLVYTIIQKHYIWMIQYWLKDQSPGFENTMALIDKWTTLLQEVLYNAVIDKSLDLTRFLFNQSNLKEWFQAEHGNQHSESVNNNP
jgi:AcrR family transcriptional regulator